MTLVADGVRNGGRVGPWLAAFSTVMTLAASHTVGAETADVSSMVRIQPYVWIAEFDGTVGAADNDSDRIDVSSGFDGLELGGFMLLSEWRRGPWSVFGDFTYAKVTSDAEFASNLLFGGGQAQVVGRIAQGAVGYALLQQEGGAVDLFGGLRYIDVDVGLDLQAGRLLPAVKLKASDDWLDGFVGLRGSFPLDERWRLSGYADVGKGGSELTWQLAASVGYQFGWGSLVGGWRHLYVDYDQSGIRIDAALTGPIVGADIRF